MRLQSKWDHTVSLRRSSAALYTLDVELAELCLCHFRAFFLYYSPFFAARIPFGQVSTASTGYWTATLVVETYNYIESISLASGSLTQGQMSHR